jgi:hypothetical protein
MRISIGVQNKLEIFFEIKGELIPRATKINRRECHNY